MWFFFIGGKDLLEKLFQDQKLCANKNAKGGLEDLILLFKYLEVLGVLDMVSYYLIFIANLFLINPNGLLIYLFTLRFHLILVLQEA